jgi:hypothetical protein
MRGREGNVSRRMPVLRRERVLEWGFQQPVDRRHHGVAVGHRQFAAEHERRLNVDDAQNVGRGIDGHAARAVFRFGTGGASALSA